MGTVVVVERWWNGTFGRLARRDVYLRTDGERWQVWVREGGREAGRSRHVEYDTETAAREALAQELSGDDWRQLRAPDHQKEGS